MREDKKLQSFRRMWDFCSFLILCPWIPASQECHVQPWGLACCWPNLTLLKSRSFFHCMDLSVVVFWVFAAGFTFGGHLSNWTIYDLKQQFSKLAIWNMHWPTIHFMQQRLVLVLCDEYEQNTKGNSLAVRTFAKRLRVNGILCWSSINKCWFA